MKQFKQWFLVALILLSSNISLHAMPVAQMKPILNMTQDNWVSFRDYDGKQYIYFTHLEMYTCAIREVHYSINSDALDKVWELQACHKENAMAVTKEIVYLKMPLHSAESIAVQLTFEDGTKSKVVHKKP